MHKTIIEEKLEKINKGKSIVHSTNTASLSKCTYIYCILRFLVDGRIKVFNALQFPNLPKIEDKKILSLITMNVGEKVNYKLEKINNKKIVKIKSADFSNQTSVSSVMEVEEIRFFIKKLKYKLDKYTENLENSKNSSKEIDIEFMLDFLEKMKLHKISNNLSSTLDAAKLDFVTLGENKQETSLSFYLNLSPSPSSVIMNLTSTVYFTYEFVMNSSVEPATLEQINSLSGSYKLAQKIKALQRLNAASLSIVPSEVLGEPQALTKSLEVAGACLLEAVSKGVYSLDKVLASISKKNPLAYKDDVLEKYINHIFDVLNLRGLNPNGFIFLSDKGLPMAYSQEGRKEMCYYTIEKMKYKSPGVFDLGNSNTIGKVYTKEGGKSLFFTLSFQLKFAPHKFSPFMIDDIIETAHEMRVLQTKGKNPLGNSKNLKYNIISSKNNIKIK